jgi:hypothetical protein
MEYDFRFKHLFNFIDSSTRTLKTSLKFDLCGGRESIKKIGSGGGVRGGK